MICYTAWQEKSSNKEALAKQRIKSFFSSRSKEYYKLYRNAFSLDQCIGESNRPVYDWFNPRKDEEPWY